MPTEELIRNDSCAKLPTLATRSVPLKQEVVLVHGGARDAYQVALALQEAGRLKWFVTDLYWRGTSRLTRILPAKIRSILSCRSASGLDKRRIVTRSWSGIVAAVLERTRLAPHSWRRVARRFSDGQLGREAGMRAKKHGSGLLSYSYFGQQAFSAYGGPAMLFQVHPHPYTVRRLLTEELQQHPQCAASLLQEWELALPEKDFQNLVWEASSATHYLVASTFTRNSLIEHGVASTSISVVPYGIDHSRFVPSCKKLEVTATLQLLFVGRINQRKGLSYLLEALRLLPQVDLHLTICGLVVDDLSIFRDFEDHVTIRSSVSLQELIIAYQQADMFVFPSVAEGFGQVLLEAMACGLPILSTTHTAAPDLIEDGIQGFIVEPRRPELLAEVIIWAASHRQELRAMGERARSRAELFTWARFRDGVNQAVSTYLTECCKAGPE